MPTREQVFTALTALVTGIPGITSVTRRMRLPGEVPPGDLPALHVWEQNEATKQTGRGIPATRTWGAWIVVYFQNEDKELPGATLINPIADAIELALAPSPAWTGVQTLGGVVSHAWIEGPTLLATGDTDTNGIGGLVVPVRMLIP